jgi:hypothetical protein
MIQESARPQWTPETAWRLSSQPVLTIGASAGDTSSLFFRIVGLARLSDGRIVVANAGTHELRFYDELGEFIGSSGRAGSGPGEYGAISWLNVTANDSILIYDQAFRRISVLGGKGEYRRTFALRGNGAQAFILVPEGVFADGSILAARNTFPAGDALVTGVVRNSVAYYRVDAQGEILDSLGQFPGLENYIRVSENWVSVSALPFARTPSAVTLGAELLVGNGATYSVAVYSSEGRLLRVMRRLTANLPVGPGHIDAYKLHQLAGIQNAEQRAEREKEFADVPFPETFPAFTAVRADSDGNIWVNDFAMTGEAVWSWSVFDPDGHWLGSVDAPRGFTIHQIGADYVLGRSLDDMDVERVVMYRLLKGERE